MLCQEIHGNYLVQQDSRNIVPDRNNNDRCSYGIWIDHFDYDDKKSKSKLFFFLNINNL